MSSSVPKLTELPVADWEYVAEGGANLVVAYTGNIPSLQETVLRIRKRSHSPEPQLTTSSLELQDEDPSVAFTDIIVIPLLKPLSNATPRLISLRVDNQSWLEQMHARINPVRPAARNTADEIDTARSYVVLAENLVGSKRSTSDQLSIEIKPKWGFLPSAAQLSSATRAMKVSHCRFCLHRLHRSCADSNGKDHASVSHDYCPLDLYSGDRARVHKAVLALFSSWNISGGKGNNWKMFRNGQMLIPHQNDSFFHSVEELVEQVTCFITASPLIRQLSRLQALLDPLDIEGLRTLVLERTSVDLVSLEPTSLKRLGGPITLSEHQAFIAKYPDLDSLRSLSDENAPTRDLIIAHLLSASFKDCSMFIRFRRPDQTTKPAVGAFLVDVDIKTIERLQKYVKMDEEIVESYQRYVQTGETLPVCRV